MKFKKIFWELKKNGNDLRVRRAAVLLVLIYHVCYTFSAVGVPGGIPKTVNISAFDVIAYVVYPWFRERH